MGIEKKKTFGYFQKWYLDLKPSTVTFYHTKTETRIVEPSYVAVPLQTAGAVPNHTLLGQPLAAGKAALAYQGTPDTAVFSPFRHGEIANYGLSVYFLKTFLSQLTPKLTLHKPVFFVHTQEQTTPVEERAWLDAGLQLGARRVYLYREPFSTLLNQLPQNKLLQNAIILHADPQAD